MNLYLTRCAALGLGALALLLSGPLSAQHADLYAHVLLGNQRAHQSWYLFEREDSQYLSQVSSTHSLGYFAQLATGRAWLQYGWEFGGHLGYDSGRQVELLIDGEGSYLGINSRLWTGDLSAGGFVSATLAGRWRLYASAGPLVHWAQLRRRDQPGAEALGGQAHTSVGSGRVVVAPAHYRYDVGLATYGRVGLEWLGASGYTLGVSVRRTTAELDFGQNGHVDLGRYPHYTLSIGAVY